MHGWHFPPSLPPRRERSCAARSRAALGPDPGRLFSSDRQKVGPLPCFLQRKLDRTESALPIPAPVPLKDSWECKLFDITVKQLSGTGIRLTGQNIKIYTQVAFDDFETDAGPHQAPFATRVDELPQGYVKACSTMIQV